MNHQKIREEVQAVIDRELIKTEQRTNFVDVLKRLREEKYVSKKQIETAMTDYLVLSDEKINDYLRLSMMTTINYNSLLGIEKSYKKGIDELNEMMDKRNYPKNA